MDRTRHAGLSEFPYGRVRVAITVDIADDVAGAGQRQGRLCCHDTEPGRQHQRRHATCYALKPAASHGSPPRRRTRHAARTVATCRGCSPSAEVSAWPGSVVCRNLVELTPDCAYSTQSPLEVELGRQTPMTPYTRDSQQRRTKAPNQRHRPGANFLIDCAASWGVPCFPGPGDRPNFPLRQRWLPAAWGKPIGALIKGDAVPPSRVSLKCGLRTRMHWY